MSFMEDGSKFSPKRIVDFSPDVGIADPKVIYRIRTAYEETPWEELWDAFLADPRVTETQELVIGLWYQDGADESTGKIPVRALVAARSKLPKLRALFLGDIDSDECEISWIYQSDMTALLQAYPELEILQIRGANNLTFREPAHDHLKTLIIETGGLSRNVVHQIGKARLPALEHLELWLGEDNYGGDSEARDLAPILAGNLFPNLTYLGLCNSDIADDIAAAVADAPILEQLEVLDLSNGNLSDVGAEALLQFPLVSRLKKLDLHHHYVSTECIERLKRENIQVDDRDQREAEDYGDGEVERYNFIGE